MPRRKLQPTARAPLRRGLVELDGLGVGFGRTLRDRRGRQIANNVVGQGAGQLPVLGCSPPGPRRVFLRRGQVAKTTEERVSKFGGGANREGWVGPTHYHCPMG